MQDTGNRKNVLEYWAQQWAAHISTSRQTPFSSGHRSRFIVHVAVPVRLYRGNSPGSNRATVPVVATNRDQCSIDQHVAHCEALVPVVGNNRDCCPGYMSPPASTLLKKFQDCVWGGVGARIFFFDCTPGVRRNVQATLRSSEHRILGRG